MQSLQIKNKKSTVKAKKDVHQSSKQFGKPPNQQEVLSSQKKIKKKAS